MDVSPTDIHRPLITTLVVDVVDVVNSQNFPKFKLYFDALVEFVAVCIHSDEGAYGAMYSWEF